MLSFGFRTQRGIFIASSKKYSINVRWWPNLQNPWEEASKSQSSKLQVPKVPFDISKSDFEWVRKIITINDIPLPNENIKAATPSGWVPPNPEISKNYSYSVRRSKNHMLPVYFKEKERKKAERSHGTRNLTIIKHIDGDMWGIHPQITHHNCSLHGWTVINIEKVSSDDEKAKLPQRKQWLH
ncbi:54S ribosomal protein L49, mitochondrial [Clonorchis sinensis]|uniref:Large ribosomal subunit protein mL49 n=1 Tax=Clonorchis sinensis TaxID=79923 RepID=A0A8T1MV12_CLOSI|nr:54S ribosomal protein L49, mitochondrial [Clonorchis sinensis]